MTSRATQELYLFVKKVIKTSRRTLDTPEKATRHKGNQTQYVLIPGLIHTTAAHEGFPVIICLISTSIWIITLFPKAVPMKELRLFAPFIIRETFQVHINT